MAKLTADKNGKFTHEYISDVFGNEPYLLHEDKFDALNENLVKNLGAEWKHEINGDDGYGNKYYAKIVEHHDEDIENGMLEINFDADGTYTPLRTHLFRVVGNTVEFVK